MITFKKSIITAPFLYLGKHLNRKHIFPFMLLIPLILLTMLRISGSSIGAYSLLYGSGNEDPDMVAGFVRGVRSDEWLVSTQMVVAQANNDFERINDNIGNGQDMSLMGDVPYKDWSAIFKPQNLIFFILPLEQAFAFRWWSLGLILVLSAYLLALKFFPKKILLSSLFASLVGLTPMMFWWYSPGIILCIAYSLLIIFLAIQLAQAGSTKARLSYSLLLSYLLVCFALILYPPFQIPCAIAVTVFMAGWILENYDSRTKLQKLLKLWPYVLMIFSLVILVGFLFYQTRKDVINAVTNTVYPGTRVEISGGANPLQAFSSFLSPNLQFDAKAGSGYLVNQSEASNFILIAPYLLIPSFYLIFRTRIKQNKNLWGLILINTLLLGFLARMFISTPWLEPFYRLLLLDKVPPSRLLLGLGFAGILQLLLVIKALDTESLLSKLELRAIALFGGISSLITMLFVGLYTIKHFPEFISSFSEVFILALWVATGIFLLLKKRFILGLILLVAFSFFSVYKVHPLYRGLGPLTESETIRTIQSYPDDKNWIVLDDRQLINFPIMAGKPSLNSVQFYPQLELWREIDRNREYEFVYNRYAHVLFVDDEQMTEPFVLKHGDLFLVKFEPCQSFFQVNVKYVLSVKQLDKNCILLDKTVDLPNTDFYIYQIMPDSLQK